MDPDPSSSSSLFMVSMSGSLELLLRQGGEQLSDEAPEGLGGDVPQTLLVIYPEGVLQLPLHGLHVGVLHQESGAQLAELSELNLSGPVLVNLEQQLLELLLGGSE